MASYTVTARNKTMSDLTEIYGDVDFSNGGTSPVEATGVTFTPALPSLESGKSGMFNILVENNATSTGTRRVYFYASFDGGTTFTPQQQIERSSPGVTQTRFTFQGTNTSGSAQTPKFYIWTQIGGCTGTFRWTSPNPIYSVWNYPFTAASDHSNSAQIEKLYLVSFAGGGYIEGFPIDTFKDLEYNVNYLMKGFTFTVNNANTVYDYQGYDIGVST